MTLVLELPSEVETELREAAAARGVAVEAVAIGRLREKHKTETAQYLSYLESLDDLLSLCARLTSGTEPLADDAVARSYADYHDAKAAT